MTKPKDRLGKFNTDFDGDQSTDVIAATFKHGEEFGPEPKLQGDTTFGLNIAWINWYCRVHSTAVWKARKEGKRQLAKLQELQTRFNK